MGYLLCIFLLQQKNLNLIYSSNSVAYQLITWRNTLTLASTVNSRFAPIDFLRIFRRYE